MVLGGVPAVAVVAALVVVPAVVLLTYAFLTGTSHQYGASLPLTLDNVTRFFDAAATGNLVRNTLVQGALVAILNLLIGLPIAYWLRYHAGRAALRIVLLFAFAFLASYVVKVYAFRTILGEHGFVNDALMAVGAIDHPLSWLLFTRFSVTVALLHITLPMTVLLLYIGFRPIELRYLELGDDLGAKRAQRWRYVVLPLMAAPAASAGILAYIFAATDYVTPALLGGPGLQTTASQAYSEFQAAGNYPNGAVQALVTVGLCAMAAAVVLLTLRLAKLNRQVYE
jgi:spermidine/putrescine transport system permease protein